MKQMCPEDRAPYVWYPPGSRSQLCICFPWNLQLALIARHPGYTQNCKIREIHVVFDRAEEQTLQKRRGNNELAHPGEQSPVGASRPEELQYLPGGQGVHWFMLDRPN